MNCKPGDLARVIDHPASRKLGMVDMFVTCGQPVVSIFGRLGVCWTVSPFKCRCRPSCPEVLDCIPYALLRPIRDPGDDAVDWVSKRTPRSVDLRDDELTQARRDLEQAS